MQHTQLLLQSLSAYTSRLLSKYRILHYLLLKARLRLCGWRTRAARRRRLVKKTYRNKVKKDDTIRESYRDHMSCFSRLHGESRASLSWGRPYLREGLKMRSSLDGALFLKSLPAVRLAHTPANRFWDGTHDGANFIGGRLRERQTQVAAVGFPRAWRRRRWLHPVAGPTPATHSLATQKFTVWSS